MWTTCPECGALVSDEVQHGLWHATLTVQTTRRTS
jgi:hypothetical protein